MEFRTQQRSLAPVGDSLGRIMLLGRASQYFSRKERSSRPFSEPQRRPEWRNVFVFVEPFSAVGVFFAMCMLFLLKWD